MHPCLVLPALVLLQTQPTFYAAWEDGRDAEAARHFEAALAAYQRAAELHPRSARQVIIYGNNVLQGFYPYTRIARCCIELGRWDAADQALAQAERESEPREERQALAARVHRPRPAEVAPSAPPAPAPAPVKAAEPAPAPPPAVAAPQPAPPPEPPRTAEPRPVERPPASVQAPPARPVPEPPRAPEIQIRQRHGVYPWLLGGLAAAVLGLWLAGRRRRPALDEAFRQPAQVGPYHIERLLGRGGFASTYLARKEGDKRPVALKLLHPFRQDDPEFLGRFRQEARLGSLLDHPNIVRLLDQGPRDTTPWLVMEYVEGQRLDVYLKERGQLPLAKVLDLARQVASAMAHAHGRGVTHRDLKPGNILMLGDQVKVMDFGIARILDSATLTTTYAFLGTPSYAAPELQLKTQVGPAADRYSFGILLFELISGQTPFRGETPFEILDQHRSAELPDLAALRPDAPRPLVDLVRRLARKNPDERPGDDEVCEILDALAGAKI
ncbi:serine/threonine-protein kinase [Geothrix sp. 21YS21S-2]|uniref:serine/threonine-protein kinase n=1 Tax=Geothrix sp. 21YS21S-2 TaxID=3068893 RepID=UPI0027BA0A35|nr:serine/threonine-protein kinase [Geothrix sp. 21YS21S-2]